MIEKWFEAFTLLERQSTADALGGESVFFVPVLEFRGVLTFTAGDAQTIAGQFALSEHPMLLHEFDVTLTPGDYVRREKDGAIYHVADHSDNMRAPAYSDLRFAQVAVERVVIPC